MKRRTRMTHAQAIAEQLLAEEIVKREIRDAYNAARRVQRRREKARKKLQAARAKTHRLKKRELERLKRSTKSVDAKRKRQSIVDETLQRLRDHSISREMFFKLLKEEGFDDDESYEILQEY